MAYILCFYVFNYIALEISLIPKLLLAHMSFMKFRLFFCESSDHGQHILHCLTEMPAHLLRH